LVAESSNPLPALGLMLDWRLKFNCLITGAIRKKCRKKYVHLIDVDLRWGVSEGDAENGKVLDICLDEIDSCRPYFLGLLGHRYGFIPPQHKHSITAQEIYHGVIHSNVPRQVLNLEKIIEGKNEGKGLNDEQIDCLIRNYHWRQDKGKYELHYDASARDLSIIRSIFQEYYAYKHDRSFFFFRSEELTKKIARDAIEDFFEIGQDEKDKLAELKLSIKDQGLFWREYDNLESFGAMAFDALWEKIEAETEKFKTEEKKEALEEEAEFHELFMSDLTKQFVGRRILLDRMHVLSEDNSKPQILVVPGKPGIGKSALMARFAEEITQNHPDWLIITHFVGASPHSTNIQNTINRFCKQIYRDCDFESLKPILFT